MVEIDGRLRRRCSVKTCDYVFWDNPTPVVAAIVQLDGDVVLVRNKGWPAKRFGLVTGFLEKGESVEQGVLREIKEELGLDGHKIIFVGYYSFYEMNQLILAFHVETQGEITLSDEIEDFKRIQPQKLRPWSFGTGPAIKDWLATKYTGRLQ
jgi:NADH pyrophosphatase NudC (nudix superfamily)